MEARTARIGFPFKGLNQNFGFGDQPEETSPDLQNVLAYDHATGRRRGGQRPALQKHISTQIADAPIQELIHLAGPGYVNQFGNGHLISRGSGLVTPYSWQMIDRNGSAVVSFDASETTYRYQMATWDTDCNAYIAMLDVATDRIITIVKYDLDGNQIWSQDITVGSSDLSARRVVRGMFALKNMLYVLFDGEGAYEGSIRRYHLSDGAEVDASPFVSAVGNVAAERYLGMYGDSVTWLAANTSRIAWGQHTFASGLIELVLINPDTGDTLSTITLVSDAANVGSIKFYGVATDGVGGTYVYYTDGSSVGHLRRYTDDGTLDWEQTYAGLASSETYATTYLPDTNQVALTGDDPVGNGDSMYIVDADDGTQDHTSSPFATCGVACNDGSGGLWVSSNTGGTESTKRLDTDYSTTLITYGNDESAEPMVSCSRPVQLQTAIKRRYVRSLAVCGGSVRRFDSAVSGVETVTNGSDALSNQPVVFGAVNLLDVYFADGENMKLYDSETNSIITWTPDVGNLPIDGNGLKARLIETWQGRIVLSGLPGDPSNWFMSKMHAPLNWDYVPSVDDQGPTQAVAGNNADAGKLGDTVTGLVPYTDDVLVMGGDNTLWQMSGNPAAGGRIDQISDITGMAWGRAWTKDPSGAIWFFGSRGGLYRLVPNDIPERASLSQIDDTLASVDLKNNIVRLAWDDRLFGLVIAITPVDLQSSTTHYFYDAREQSFFPIKFANNDHDPLVLHLYDGDDPDDRVLLFGCKDGYIRKFDIDGSTYSDDGTAIDSYVVLGPVQSEDQAPVLVNAIRGVLSTDSSDVTVAMLSGDSSQAATSASETTIGTMSSGINQTFRRRVSGHAHYIKLRNNTDAESWAMEHLSIDVRPMGQKYGRRFS